MEDVAVELCASLGSMGMKQALGPPEDNNLLSCTTHKLPGSYDEVYRVMFSPFIEGDW